MATETRRSGLLLGIVIGGAVGAVSSLLLAPKTGAKMREDLSNRYRSIMEKTQDLAAAAREKTKEAASGVSDQATDLIDKAKEGKQQIVDTIQAAKDTVQNRASETSQDKTGDNPSDRETNILHSKPN